MSLHPFRSHTCGQLRAEHADEEVKLSGWIHRKRDHGNLLFIDLRDHYGITQCVIDCDNDNFSVAEQARLESVITVTGTVTNRDSDAVNKNLPTGEIELQVKTIVVENAADVLPMPVNSDQEFPEDTRLTYRYLDLRREKMHNNIVLRSKVISTMRSEMIKQGFLEIQTPILTSSSPEGARDFLVPSRLHPGKFYALPQAPQQFKQLLMASGFDRYFQIAPCFRDEDARADRSPGEFYQLDYEMAFVTQDEVFEAIEPVLYKIFTEFSNKTVDKPPFKRIPFAESMLKYGSDKPDLRNPIEITDVTDVFIGSGFSIFEKQISSNGAVVRAIPAPNSADKPRSFFDKMNDWARSEGAPGLGYIVFENGEGRGPIAKFFDKDRLEKLKNISGCKDGDSLFFACSKESDAASLAGKARTRIGEEMGLIDQSVFKFCWVIDFPMFEVNEDTGQIEFSHNPFSMPQGGLDALENMDPLEVKAYQYDIVCNGIELSSGAIRNHNPKIMEKAFEVAGYDKSVLETKFAGMYNAFKFGAPPHGGCAPGIDRIVMLLADEPNIREIVAFPMNQQAQDLLMGAPGEVSEKQLKDLSIKINMPKNVMVNEKNHVMQSSVVAMDKEDKKEQSNI